MLTPHHVGRAPGRILNSLGVLALPSRDFRISLRRVRIPGANEERSGTLVAARRKKKEAPRPRYVARTQTGVLVPTSLRIRPRERASERARACVHVLRVCKYSLLPSFPVLLVPSGPLGPRSRITCTPAARTLPRPQIEAPEKKRCVASPRSSPLLPPSPSRTPFSLSLFLTRSSAAEGKEEEEEENGESRWGNARGDRRGTTRLSWHKEERGRGKRRRWKRLKAKAPCWWR